MLVHGLDERAPGYTLDTVNAIRPGQGIAYLANPGTFYLDIEAQGEWIVKAVSIEEAGDSP